MQGVISSSATLPLNSAAFFSLRFTGTPVNCIFFDLASALAKAHSCITPVPPALLVLRLGARVTDILNFFFISGQAGRSPGGVFKTKNWEIPTPPRC